MSEQSEHREMEHIVEATNMTPTYRILGPNEMVLEGDEWFCKTGIIEWLPVSDGLYGMVASDWPLFKFRRKLSHRTIPISSVVPEGTESTITNAVYVEMIPSDLTPDMVEDVFAASKPDRYRTLGHEELIRAGDECLTTDGWKEATAFQVGSYKGQWTYRFRRKMTKPSRHRLAKMPAPPVMLEKIERIAKNQINPEVLQDEIEKLKAEMDVERARLVKVQMDNFLLEQNGKMLKVVSEQWELKRELDHWKNNHKEMVERNALLRTRPDLKERAPMIEALIKERDELKAENARLKTALELKPKE